LELGEAEASILVCVVFSNKRFPFEATVFAVEVIEDSKFVWADLLVVVLIVLLEDSDWI
jgi:hypothetical protein